MIHRSWGVGGTRFVEVYRRGTSLLSSVVDRGFVVFWEGHVGIMVDKLNCIHANAFHMKTVVEPLKEIISRMGGKNPIKKIMNFN